MFCRKQRYHLSLLLLLCSVCTTYQAERPKPSAAEMLGNKEYRAVSFGAYRTDTRATVPTVEQLEEDVKLLSAIGIKLLRTYNTQEFPQAKRLLKAIQNVRNKDPNFEMYVMLGAWINADNAWSNDVNHDGEDEVNNSAEVNTAIKLANQYPQIVKMIAVGNESMVHWQEKYFVKPKVILKYVNLLQQKKREGRLAESVWITSSDNFASWGGGDKSYHTDDLLKLIRAVDFISLHTYPFHDTHYNNDFWLKEKPSEKITPRKAADIAIKNAVDYAKSQYNSVADYLKSNGIKKPIHIGETGWADVSAKLYGAKGSQAADEYKQKRYHDAIRKWTDSQGITCFYFEAFDEPWKDYSDANGSENHFGLFTVNGTAKYVLWDAVDSGKFKGLSRDGTPIRKTFNGNIKKLMASLLPVPYKNSNESKKAE